MVLEARLNDGATERQPRVSLEELDVDGRRLHVVTIDVGALFGAPAARDGMADVGPSGYDAARASVPPYYPRAEEPGGSSPTYTGRIETSGQTVDRLRRQRDNARAERDAAIDRLGMMERKHGLQPLMQAVVEDSIAGKRCFIRCSLSHVEHLETVLRAEQDRLLAAARERDELRQSVACATKDRNFYREARDKEGKRADRLVAERDEFRSKADQADAECARLRGGVVEAMRQRDALTRELEETKAALDRRIVELQTDVQRLLWERGPLGGRAA